MGEFSKYADSIIGRNCDQIIEQRARDFLDKCSKAHTAKSKKTSVWNLLAEYLDEILGTFEIKQDNKVSRVSFSSYAKDKFNNHWNHDYRDLKQQMNPSYSEDTFETLWAIINFCRNRKIAEHSRTERTFREFCAICYELTEIFQVMADQSRSSGNHPQHPNLDWYRASLEIDFNSVYELFGIDKNSPKAESIKMKNTLHCQNHIPPNFKVPSPIENDYGADIKKVKKDKTGLYANNFDQRANAIRAFFRSRNWPIPPERVCRLITYCLMFPTKGKSILTYERQMIANAVFKRKIFFAATLPTMINASQVFAVDAKSEMLQLSISKDRINIEYLKDHTDIHGYPGHLQIPVSPHVDISALHDQFMVLLGIMHGTERWKYIKDRFHQSRPYDVYLPDHCMTLHLNSMSEELMIDIVLDAKFYLNESVLKEAKAFLKHID